MIVVDTSVLVALLNRRERLHENVRSWYEGVTEELVTTPLVLAEVDHLARAAGDRAVRAFRGDVATGAYGIEWWPGAAAESVEIAERYRDLRLELTDASLVALASRVGTINVGTLDERHFRVVRPLAGGDAFTILPADR